MPLLRPAGVRPLQQDMHTMALELNANRRIGLALLWLALLAVAGFWLSETLKVTGDLRKFMPALRKNKAPLQPDAARAAGVRSAAAAGHAHHGA
ncbi:hypothetical protein ACQR5V_06435 [Xanthomonas oryzae pv. oryzicola]|uniref:hypothetical protein n=1 Tax=Xanthomonas oryzae TaxID=347 RepID=UPI0005CEB177|nr:hypothetical protein [Xanthomonas oryzae]AJQ89432.1 membrane protein [Xanthomonas oryzae pv. oryzicola]OWB33578.1 hypothetical protein XocBAI21_02485 [Xanthomonas oryzae pv. oryzicola]